MWALAVFYGEEPMQCGLDSRRGLTWRPQEEKAGAMAVWASFDREPATAALWVSMVNFSDPSSSGSTLGLLTTTYLAPTTSYLQQRAQRHMDV